MKTIVSLLFLTLGVFGSTLNGLVSYGLKHSTIIAQTQTQIELSKLQRKSSQVQRFGELNMIGEYNHYNIERTLAPLVPSSIVGGTPITTSNDIFTMGLRYSVPLFTGFAQTRQIQIDELSNQMSQMKMRLTKEQLIYNIRSLYLSILAQEEILKAQNRYALALQKLTKLIAYEVKVGKKASIDLFKAQSDTQAVLTQVEVLHSTIETTKATLSALVGKEVNDLQPINIKIKKPYYLVNKLYERSSRLAKLKVDELAIKKASRRIEKTKASSLPQVSLAMYGGKNYGQDVKTEDWDNETLWQVGVNVKYNLVDFGKRKITTQKAKIAKLQGALKKKQTLLDLKKLLTQGIQKVKRSYAEYLGNMTQYKLSKKAQKIEKVRYKNDASTLNDLLLAQAKSWLTNAKVIQSKYEYQKSKYYIDYLMERGTK